VEARYERKLAETATAMARVYYDWYEYLGKYVYDLAEPGQPADLLVNRDESVAEGVGGEIQLNWSLRRRHSATLGADFRNDYRQMMKNFDEAPRVDYLDINPGTAIFGFYVQDEFRPWAGLVLTGGVRYDHYDSFGEAVNPRLACVYDHAGMTTLKLLFGKAFRAPNVNEFYYEDDGLTSKINPDLNPETITTYEVVCEQRIRRNWRGSVAVFRNEVNDLIDMVQDPEDSLYYSANLDEVTANGAEFSVDGQVGEKTRARASYTYAKTEDKATGEPLNNAPEHLGKLNLTVPVIRDRVRAGGETQYVSRRNSVGGETLGGLWLVNVTLFSATLVEGIELSASAYNVFDSNYRDPTSGDLDAVEQDGRTFRLKVLYRF
jgi:iron complex outermembrane receptor protein